MNPYEEGYTAAQRRTERPRCPYDKSSIKSNRWWSGYHAGERERTRQQQAPVEIDGYTQLALFGGA